jgi:LytS/YehU family sensor histidine kinase
LWYKKQQEWLQVQQEKIAAELHLLKAQLHPHFLFNTLNNIYSFALENSSKTPYLILKLSSLLRYILYECRSEEVMLEKELEVMKNYIDLERERYGEKIDITICMEGEIAGKKIAPLLLLPFLENAFKHGTSEQLDKPWLRVGILVEGSLMTCKIINSKNETGFGRKNGVGIHNVQSRLRLLYPGKYTLHLYDEGNQYIVNLVLQLPSASAFTKQLYNHQSSQKFSHETSLSTYR